MAVFLQGKQVMGQTEGKCKVHSLTGRITPEWMHKAFQNVKRNRGAAGVADISAVVNELTAAENGVVVFTSSTGGQYSLEDPEWGNGHGPTMRLLSRLEDERKSGAIWYKIFRQSPKAPVRYRRFPSEMGT